MTLSQLPFSIGGINRPDGAWTPTDSRIVDGATTACTAIGRLSWPGMDKERPNDLGTTSPVSVEHMLELQNPQRPPRHRVCMHPHPDESEGPQIPIKPGLVFSFFPG